MSLHLGLYVQQFSLVAAITTAEQSKAIRICILAQYILIDLTEGDVEYIQHLHPRHKTGTQLFFFLFVNDLSLIKVNAIEACVCRHSRCTPPRVVSESSQTGVINRKCAKLFWNLRIKTSPIYLNISHHQCGLEVISYYKAVSALLINLILLVNLVRIQLIHTPYPTTDHHLIVIKELNTQKMKYMYIQ